jgi:hypothetical protein
VRSEWQLEHDSPVSHGSLSRAAAVLVGLSTLSAALLSSQPLSDLPARRSAATAPVTVIAQARPGGLQAARPPRTRVTRVEHRAIQAAPRHEHFSELPLARVEGAERSERHSGADEREAPVRIATAPVEPPGTTRIDTLEAELSRAVVKRASARLLLAMTELPSRHAGSEIQTP